MRSLNPDTDSHTIKTGKEGFTLKANQKEENLNGCAALTKTESKGIDTDIEALETYICDNICQYREKTTSQEALEYYFCSSCEMSKHISKIKTEYDNKTMCYCRTDRGLGGRLEAFEGCSRGKERE